MAKRVMMFLIIAAISVLGLSGSLYSSVFTEILSVFYDVSSTNGREGNAKAMKTYQVDATTAATREILGLEYSVQPGQYWIYDGESLRDIYEATYVVDAE